MLLRRLFLRFKMVKKVIKKSGKKQKFDSKKIRKSIEKACKECKISKKRIEKEEEKILKEVLEIAEKRGVTTAEIRDIVLRDLSDLDPSVVRAWIAFEIMKLQKKNP